MVFWWWIHLNKIMQIYKELKKMYGFQGWWPIINNKTLICEYGMDVPRNETEALEICLGAILTQGTQWYPNVVRAIQQLKLGREFKKRELEAIKQAEIHRGIIRGRPRKQITSHILTQNTSWKNIEEVIKELKIKNLLSKEGIEKINEEKLSIIIRSSGYYKQKARKLKEFVKFLNSGKEITRENLLSIWGIGEETADSILLYAYNKPVFVIDTYTKRIMDRFGFGKLNYMELQSLFMDNLDKDVKLYKEYHALLVKLGKDYCKKKALCEECPLKCKKKGF